MAKILVADDERLIRQLVCDFLNQAGHETLEANNGAQALELFRENPDTELLILDIMMPEVDGWEVTREVRKASNVPIILLSARGEEFDQLTGFDAGADEYVTKPFSPVVLVKRAEALLRRGAADDETLTGIAHAKRTLHERTAVPPPGETAVPLHNALHPVAQNWR